MKEANAFIARFEDSSEYDIVLFKFDKHGMIYGVKSIKDNIEDYNDIPLDEIQFVECIDFGIKIIVDRLYSVNIDNVYTPGQTIQDIYNKGEIQFVLDGILSELIPQITDINNDNIPPFTNS